MQRLLPLGTCAGKATMYRNTTSTLIELDNGKCILIDCGDGILNQLIKMGFNLDRIELILITHIHSDHIGGLISILFGWEVKNCEVFIPKGGQELLDVFAKLSNHNIGKTITVKEIPDGDLMDLTTLKNGITIKSFPIPHGIQSHGFLIEDKRGLKFAYLGDTSGRDLTFLGKVHVLVHECTFNAHIQTKYDHSNPNIAGTAANQCQADYLLLNHFSARYNTPEDFKGIRNDTKKVTNARIYTLEDFRYFNLYTIKV